MISSNKYSTFKVKDKYKALLEIYQLQKIFTKNESKVIQIVAAYGPICITDIKTHFYGRPIRKKELCSSKSINNICSRLIKKGYLMVRTYKKSKRTNRLSRCVVLTGRTVPIKRKDVDHKEKIRKRCADILEALQPLGKTETGDQMFLIDQERRDFIKNYIDYLG